nr:MAG TPA: hypothetical protein [Caudoviricetes sp.]
MYHTQPDDIEFQPAAECTVHKEGRKKETDIMVEKVNK